MSEEGENEGQPGEPEAAGTAPEQPPAEQNPEEENPFVLHDNYQLQSRPTMLILDTADEPRIASQGATLPVTHIPPENPPPNDAEGMTAHITANLNQPSADIGPDRQI